MPRHDIIVVGASAGGVEALTRLVARLPAKLAASLFVVLHVPPHAQSNLPGILSRAGPLPAVHPSDGAAIERGHIYVAPPDHNLLIGKGTMQVIRGGGEFRHRPSVDALFRSAATAYGARVVGVVLSGTQDDGSSGLLAIKAARGVAVIQDPADAHFPDMPENARAMVDIDYVVPIWDMGNVLAGLTRPIRKASTERPAPT